MESKKVSEHLQKLLTALDHQEQVTTPEAMELLGLSEASVRRLFTRLAQRGNAVRTYGGIGRASKAVPYHYEQVKYENSGAKAAIALQAANLVHSGQTLYLDGGSTLELFAKELARQIKQGTLQNLTLFTNALSTLTALQDTAPVTLLGGTYREQRQDFCGYVAEDALRRLRFDACFLGTDAAEPTRGFTTTDFDTARLNERVIQSAQACYILADSSKFSKTSLVPFATFDTVRVAVCAPSLPSEIRAEFTKNHLHFL